MNEPATVISNEITILCPVCKKPRIFVDPEIDIGDQISFLCYSRRCGGKKRHIKKSDFDAIVRSNDGGRDH